MEAQFYWFLLSALAVWRITHALAAEDGPWNCFLRMRQVLSGRFKVKLLDCFYCLSLWVAAPIAAWLGRDLKEKFLLWLASSAAAILLQRATIREDSVTPAEYFEHQGANQDAVLRER